MSACRLLFCAIFVGSVTQCCVAGDDPVERLLLSIQQNRSARMLFDYDFCRNSPLLDRPITDDLQIESEINESVGRVVKLRRIPDDINWELLRLQLRVERPAAGDGISWRTELVRRQGQLLSVSVPVSANQPTIVNNPGARFALILKDPALSTVGDNRSQSEQQRNLLRLALYNFALGVVLQNTIEDFVGKSSNRVLTDTAGEVTCISETRFGKCTLHWSNPEAVYPDRLTVQLSGDDVLFDKPLYEVSLNGGKGWPAGGVRSVTAEVSDIRIAEYGTNVVPVAWSSINSYECADGSTVVERCKIRLAKFEFGGNESSAGKVQVAVPMRHEVSVEDAHQLQYVWDGDWAVPALPKQAEAPDDSTIAEYPSAEKVFAEGLAWARSEKKKALVHFVKEPAYMTQPRYCLLVFGLNGETRVWVVEDGETLYVDLNANGDLTEQGEAFQPTKKRQLSGYRDAEYETAKIVPSDGSSTHTEFKIGYYQTDDEPVHHFIKVKVNGKQQQFAGWRPIFSDAKHAAKIFHFGGKFAPRPLRKNQLSLTGDKQELHLSWFTQGQGEDARVMLGYEAVPKDITPLAEIEWPSDNPNETVLTKVELVHRC